MFKFNVHRLSFILNNACNMSCKHCFQHDKFRHNTQLSGENINDFVDFFLSINNKDKIELTLIGGEPTLYNNYEELSRGLKKIIDAGVSFSIVRLFTNGFLINYKLNKVLTFLKTHSDTIDIWITKDIDPGDPDRLINGESINNFVDRSAERYSSLGYNVNFQSVFTKRNVHRFKHILDNIKSDKNAWLEFGYPCDQSNDLDFSDFEYMVNTFLDYISKNDVDEHFVDRCNMNIFIKSSNYSRMHYPTCDPIKGELSISPMGYIIPCVKCLDIESSFKKYHISKITPEIISNDEFLDKFIAIDDVTESGEFCRDCVLKDVCVPCRLLLTLIDVNQNKITHSDHKCERIFNFYKIKLNLINKFIENGGKNLWLEK